MHVKNLHDVRSRLSVCSSGTVVLFQVTKSKLVLVVYYAYLEAILCGTYMAVSNRRLLNS